MDKSRIPQTWILDPKAGIGLIYCKATQPTTVIINFLLNKTTIYNPRKNHGHGNWGFTKGLFLFGQSSLLVFFCKQIEILIIMFPTLISGAASMQVKLK